VRRTTRSPDTGALAATKPVLPPSPWYVVQPDSAEDADADGEGEPPVVVVAVVEAGGEEVEADEGVDDGEAVPLQAATPSVAAARRPARGRTSPVSGPVPPLSPPAHQVPARPSAILDG